MPHKSCVMQALGIAYGTMSLLLAAPCDAFIGAGLPRERSFNPRASTSVILQAGGKFNKDPNAASRIAELIAKFQKNQRQYSEHPNKYMEDAMDAIKRHDPALALESFDRALAVDNETLVWHRGAMLYYAGRYEEAVTHLQRTASQFEEKMEAPATEERLWKTAALMRLYGKEKAVTTLEEPRFGGEKRFLMGLVFDMFRGKIQPEQLVAVIDHHASNEFTNYDLYGNFYLGLYYDALGSREEGNKYMGRATEAKKARKGDIMYHLPRLHLINRQQ